jgi:hypothetical protein
MRVRALFSVRIDRHARAVVTSSVKGTDRNTYSVYQYLLAELIVSRSFYLLQIALFALQSK